ncbi:hypothetical protein JCM10212_003302 [Sporobolomyces blumeae]
MATEDQIKAFRAAFHAIYDGAGPIYALYLDHGHKIYYRHGPRWLRFYFGAEDAIDCEEYHPTTFRTSTTTAALVLSKPHHRDPMGDHLWQLTERHTLTLYHNLLTGPEPQDKLIARRKLLGLVDDAFIGYDRQWWSVFDSRDEHGDVVRKAPSAMRLFDSEGSRIFYKVDRRWLRFEACHDDTTHRIVCDEYFPKSLQTTSRLVLYCGTTVSADSIHAQYLSWVGSWDNIKYCGERIVEGQRTLQIRRQLLGAVSSLFIGYDRVHWFVFNPQTGQLCQHTPHSMLASLPEGYVIAYRPVEFWRGLGHHRRTGSYIAIPSDTAAYRKIVPGMFKMTRAHGGGFAIVVADPVEARVAASITSVYLK